MSIEHQLREAAARCLALLQRYYHSERSEKAKATMVAEVEVVIGWLTELAPPSNATESYVLRPVEEQLIASYGHEAGARLNGEFVDVFEGSGLALLSRPERQNRRLTNVDHRAN